MLWWIGSGLIIAWVVLWLVHPRGWIPFLLVGGFTILVVQTAAYRKTKAARKHHE